MKISRHSRSILEEINSFVPKKSKADIVETKAQHILSSALHLFEYIDNNFSQEEADNLKNRFMSSIRGADVKRFTRAIQKIKEDDTDE